MTEVKKTPVKRKTRAKAKPKPKVETEIKKPTKPIATAFTFVGIEGIQQLLGPGADEITGYVKKFQGRYGVKLHYIARFKAFKLFRQNKHVDWISLNELMKRYDCRIPPVKETSPIQRPYKKDRIY